MLAVFWREKSAVIAFRKPITIAHGIVEKAHAAFHGAFDERLGFLFIFGDSDMMPAEAEGCDFFTGLAERALRQKRTEWIGCAAQQTRAEDCRGARRAEEFASCGHGGMI